MTDRSSILPTLFVSLAVFVFIGCGDAAEDPATTSDPAPSTESSESAMMPAENAAKVNLNTGTEEQFLAIPDVGDRMVHEFEEYRPYVSIQQFRREMGKYVDEAQVTAYEQYVFVPVSPNNSDEATLMQLPGVDASIASDLVAARPFASNDAFIAALGDHVSAEQAAQARSYLTTP